MQSYTVFDDLQMAISPVIMISAYGMLLLSMTNRLGRAIDRARLLSGEPATQPTAAGGNSEQTGAADPCGHS